jgi:hypothetical protein
VAADVRRRWNGKVRAFVETAENRLATQPGIEDNPGEGPMIEA